MATTKNIQSVQRAFAILESFQKSGRKERSVKEIAVSLGLNKSTAFGLINTLAELGYLQQNAENQKYYLGLKLLTPGLSVRQILQAVRLFSGPAAHRVDPLFKGYENIAGNPPQRLAREAGRVGNEHHGDAEKSQGRKYVP